MSIGLLGTILGAVSGAGNAAQASLAQDQKFQDDQQMLQTKAALDLKNQQILQHSQAVDIPNELRAGLLQRIAPTQDQLDAVRVSNAQADPHAQWVDEDAVMNPDGTAVAGTPTVVPAITDLSDADKVQYAPTDKQILALQIANAKASGDIAVAAELTKIADASKISVGYGGKVVDESDIDPVTHKPRVLVDNPPRQDTQKTTAGARRPVVSAPAAVPGPAQPPIQKFIVGQAYTDAAGNRATYGGGSTWTPIK